MIDGIRDVFGRDDEDAEDGDTDPEADADEADPGDRAPEAVADELVDAVRDGRHLSGGGVDYGAIGRYAAGALAAAFAADVTDDREDYPRPERYLDAEEKALDGALAALEDRREELVEEREARRESERHDFTAPPSPINTGHPRKDRINDALRGCVEYLEEHGEASVDALYEVYASHAPAREAERSWFVARALEAFREHPNVAPNPSGLWTLDAEDALDDAALADALANLPVGDANARVVRRAYEHVREAPVPIGWTGGDWWQEEGVDHLAALDGVRPPEDGAPAFRYVDDGDADAEAGE